MTTDTDPDALCRHCDGKGYTRDPVSYATPDYRPGSVRCIFCDGRGIFDATEEGRKPLFGNDAREPK